MKCFYHRDRDAIGVCRSCGRALCHDCFETDIDSMYIYCKGSKKCKTIEYLSKKALKRQVGHRATFLRYLLIITAICIAGYVISLAMPPAPLPPLPVQ